MAIAIAIGGCYRPGDDPACEITCTQGDPSTCPSGLVCGNANLCEPKTGQSCSGILDARMDSDVDIDAPIDGRMPLSCDSTSFPSTPETLISGFHVTVDRTLGRMSIVSSNEVRVNETVPNSGNPSDYVLATSVPPGSIEMFSGRIDPSGAAIYASSDDGAPTIQTFVYVSQRVQLGVWTNYQAVTFKDGPNTITLPYGLAVGAATDPALGARRLPIGRFGASFDEFVEATPGALSEFTYLSTTSAMVLGVSLVRDPSFSADGLRVVFVGQQQTAQGIYTATRAGLSDPWNMPVFLRPATSQDQYPYLTANCEHLYWTSNSMVRHLAHHPP